jgi:hypothetical protein
MKPGEMMKDLIFKGFTVFLFLVAFQAAAIAAPPCKGPNKNDPGCPGADPPPEESEPEPAPGPVVVDSVTVDWLNEKLVVRGSGLTGAGTFLLGSGVTPLVTANLTDAELDIPFSGDIATEVLSQGNYKLDVDGTIQLSIYIESQIVDPGAGGCPCLTEWTLAPETDWGSPSADCLEISGPGSNDAADISGTIGESGVYPQYPIGASFYPGDPDSSVCRLVSVNADASVTELVNYRINETQQAVCAGELATYVCATVTPVP